MQHGSPSLTQEQKTDKQCNKKTVIRQNDNLLWEEFK